MDLSEASDNQETGKKHNNLVWWLLLIFVMGPSIFLAWSIITQPAGNEIYYSLDRPDVGIGFDIQKSEVIDGNLELTVSYLGGCSDHKFDLYVEEQKSEINRQLTLYHSTDESCQTKVVEDLKYDIQSVIDEHDSEQVVFTIVGNGQEPDPILVKKPRSE
ncbi:MAG: hypothetical protein R3313_04415 [Candidatus Saccharimonadales bacterium]|nr:hypothetical protein [Candidatus Saccharimonadales bacterium]